MGNKEKKDFFKPIVPERKKCVVEPNCLSYPNKCGVCDLNPNKKQIPVKPVPEKRTVQGLRNKLGQSYSEMPNELKFT